VAEASEQKVPIFSRVRDYMTPEPVTLGLEHSLLDAVLMLRRSNLRHIPILENGRLVGLLSDRDVARMAPSMLTFLPQEEYNRVFEETPVGKVMTRNPISTSPDASLAEAVDLLYVNRLGCLPVLQDGKLVGIITVSDMLRALHDLVSSAPSSATPVSPVSSPES
jgi:acetoin utilization protein AcuB